MSTAAQPDSASTQNASASGRAGGYEVSRPHGQCAVTGRQIEPGEKLMAALRETPEGFERLDIALDAWPQYDRAGVLAFWQTVMPAPEQKARKIFVDDQVLCELFERLATAEDPAKLNFRFVLGLILMRKRMLVYESSRTDAEGRDVWTVRFKGREALLEMLNPRLDEQQVLEVSRQLGEILNEEL